MITSDFRLLTTGLILLLSGFLHAQSSIPVVWGQIPDEQEKLEVYSYFPEAEAVILNDFGIWYPGDAEGRTVKLKRHIRIKILKPEGLKYKDVVIRYQTRSKYEQVKNLRAQTINFEGSRKVKNKLALKLLPPKDLQNGERELSFTFREVKVGSIIEYAYDLETDEIDNLNPWYFQNKIPTVESEVRLAGFIPRAYQAFPQNISIELQENDFWKMKHIAPLPDLPFLLNYDANRIGIRFQYRDFTTIMDDVQAWQEFSHWLEEATLLLDDSVSQRAIFALAQSLIRDAITEEEKIAAIYNHVRNHVRWNGVSDYWVNQSAAQLYRSQEGHSGEINMLLAHLLWQAGVTAYRGFVATRDYGKPLDVPLFNQFNDVFILAIADGQSFIMDATDPLRPYDLPPLRLLNGKAWLIRDSTAGWSNIPDRYMGEKLISGRIILDEQNDGITGIFQEYLKGYFALETEKRFRKAGEEKFWAAYLDSSSVIKNPGLHNADQTHLPLELTYEFFSKKWTRKEANRLHLIPMAHYTLTRNPFKENTRNRPVEYDFLRDEQITISIQVGEDWEIEKIPDSKRVMLPGMEVSFNYTAEKTGNVIHVSSHFQVRKSVIFPEDYGALKKLYDHITELMNQEVILRRTRNK